MTRNLLSPNAAFSSLFMRSKADFPKSEDSASWMRNLKLPIITPGAELGTCVHIKKILEKCEQWNEVKGI